MSHGLESWLLVLTHRLLVSLVLPMMRRLIMMIFIVIGRFYVGQHFVTKLVMLWRQGANDLVSILMMLNWLSCVGPIVIMVPLLLRFIDVTVMFIV